MPQRNSPPATTARDASATAPHEPAWTRARLFATLIECYGTTKRGTLNVKLVAADFKVSVSTVRNWLRGADSDPAAIPAARLRQLRTGGPAIERRADGQIAYAHNAIQANKLPHRRNVIPQWDEQEWFTPHAVVLIAVYGRPWHQLILSKHSSIVDDARRRGEVIDVATVPTKFHGDLLVRAAMQRQAAWAIRPHKSQLEIGRGQLWAEDAPALNLSALAVEQGLR